MKRFVIVATVPGKPEVLFLERKSAMSTAWVLTNDVREAATSENYGSMSQILDRMADFGAFPDYRLSVGEVSAIKKGSGK